MTTLLIDGVCGILWYLVVVVSKINQSWMFWCRFLRSSQF